ncbi:metal-sensitive transcriptional regulator [Bacillaceae bacterium SIJ1]|uniref:metal-sensitive transcriptional regulator n=1 Tax=Litoribacterium kuwaitense TaxID=1398745 RepID=UPI0013ED5215|nr:metal-sensitive transcriptional regulator [Litoribacterium kuwaitense]NGP45584.1 metal-sensitive transcriptional regulator [Litoribacterium kuwaitense]
MEYDAKVINRVKRIEGQVRGLISMMEEGKDCREVVPQMTAVRNAIDRTAAVVVSKNLEQCIREEKDNGQNAEQLIQEAVNMLVKSR